MHSSGHVSLALRRGCQPEGHCEEQKGGHLEYSFFLLIHYSVPLKGLDSQVTALGPAWCPVLESGPHRHLSQASFLWILAPGCSALGPSEKELRGTPRREFSPEVNASLSDFRVTAH